MSFRRCGFRHERRLRALGIGRIAGIDEAGRGALAGPVVAAAVILPEKFRHRKLNDSKQLAPELREEIYHHLIDNAEILWAVGIVDALEIDEINILRATHKAMRAAIAALTALPRDRNAYGAARSCAHRWFAGVSFSTASDRHHRW